MNLLCPACQKMITVPDQYAGQTMKCPLCSQLFPAPVLPSGNPLPPPVEPSPSSAGTAQTVSLAAIGTSSGAKEPGFVFFQGGRLFVRFAAGADAALPSARGGDFRAS